MPRRLRLHLVNVLQHIIQRGNNRQATFFAEEDFCFYLERLDEGARKYACSIYAYVLMTNHVHLLASAQRPYALIADDAICWPVFRTLHQSRLPAQRHAVGRPLSLEPRPG